MGSQGPKMEHHASLSRSLSKSGYGQRQNEIVVQNEGITSELVELRRQNRGRWSYATGDNKDAGNLGIGGGSVAL